MRNDTRVLYNQYLDRQAELNGVDNAATKFTVSPTVQQTLENKIQESSAFLSRINIIGVSEQTGEKLGLGVSGTIASRTDTSSTGERATSDIASLEKDDYGCKQTNYDHHIRYATMDAWAKFPDFQTRVRNAVLQRAALDRIMIGWNGTSAAATTNRSTNPLLQDVNIGWLSHIKTKAEARVLSEGVVTGKVTYGGAGDYKNLDALVYDAYQTLLDNWYREDPQLVAVVGRGLMHDKLFPLVNDNDAPTERLAADIVVSQKRLGGLQAVQVPFFPAGKVLVTRLDNLSIYFQEGARRRAVMDNPKKDRVEHYESSNDAFVVEDYGMCALVENIEEYVAP